MTTQPKAITHLPLLYNPFLNCLFNNPHYTQSPFKQTIQELAQNHNDYAILVPPANILNDCYDPISATSSSKIPLHELCYNNEDFIRSHVVRTNAVYSSTITPITKVQLMLYNTMNGKQVLIKNGMIFPGKGFKKSLKLSILNVTYFTSFCNYFPEGSRFMLIFINDSLFGSYEYLPTFYTIQPPKPDTSTTSQNAETTVTFEELLRNFPLLSKAVSDKFYRLFHHNNYQFRVLRTNTHKKLDSIKLEFQNMLEEAFRIVLESVKVDSLEGEQTYNLINHILSIYPGLNLNAIIHEYVELNLYDKLWSQLVFQFNYTITDKEDIDKDAIRILTSDMYNSLSCLSLNQLDLPIEEPWKMNELLKRVHLAIEEFSRLSDATIVNLHSKAKVIVNTVNQLTKNISPGDEVSSDDDFLVDADTLIGLLIIVVVHSKIPNLEAHIYYIKNFNSANVKNEGYFSYMLSNIEAVIYHLSDRELNLNQLVESSQKNFEFWSIIQHGYTERLLDTLGDVKEQYGDETPLPDNHFIKSRNIHGESCLMFAVKSGNIDVFKTLLDFEPSWFSIDDILFDKNTTTNQTLVMVALTEECHEILVELIDIIITNATLEEQLSYFNLTDTSGRSAGHYLFHDHTVISKVGHLIDWQLKDLNSHTPLFSVCRCYDHVNYKLLVQEAFQAVYKQYSKQDLINFDTHIDKSGSTILHIMLKDLSSTELLSRENNLVNVNQLNNKLIVPLALYVKYNRLDNLKDLLNDNRLFFLFEDPKNFYNIFDHLSFLASKSLSSNKILKQIEVAIYSHFFQNYYKNSGSQQKLAIWNAKFDTNLKDWLMFFSLNGDVKNNRALNVHSLNTIRQKLQVFKMKYPFSPFIPESFWINHPVGKPVIPFFSKFRINRTIENLNLLFLSLNCYPKQFQEEFIIQFIKAHDENLTFDLIQNIHKDNDKVKYDLGKIKLKPLHIDEFNMFLNFSREELIGFQSTLNKLNKLVIVGDIKESDIRIISDRYVNKMMRSLIFPPRYFGRYHVDLIREYRGQDSGMSTLAQFTNRLLLGVSELIRSIDGCLEKIGTWKSTYGKIKEYNHELKKFEEKVLLSPVANPVPASPTISTASTNFSTEIELSDDEVDDDSGFGSFFNFGNIMENKKSRYKKVLLAKSEEVKKIMKLNVDIKVNHEAIASEISQFMRFRSEFMTLALKRVASDNITNLRNRNFELLTMLHAARR